ncbi:hypothetical protein [Erythrobacter alti]|uniref:hypothetical protein n=1 Tax=Erythrobacter alti TaxID=1896145 RepID=UPI0030F41F81
MDMGDDQEEGPAQHVAQDPALELDLHPTRLSVGPTRVLLNWRLDLANTSGSHIIALRVWSDMVSAHSSVPSEEQLGGPDMEEARLNTIAQLEPGTKANLMGEWQISRNAVRAVENSRDSLILPLARFRLVGAGITPQRRAFVIGSPPAPGEKRLRALQLTGEIQILARLSAREVTQAPVPQ